MTGYSLNYRSRVIIVCKEQWTFTCKHSQQWGTQTGATSRALLDAGAWPGRASGGGWKPRPSTGPRDSQKLQPPGVSACWGGGGSSFKACMPVGSSHSVIWTRTGPGTILTGPPLVVSGCGRYGVFNDPNLFTFIRRKQQRRRPHMAISRTT